MSGSWYIRCGFCDAEFEAGRAREGTVRDLIRSSLKLEHLIKTTELDFSDLRGEVYEHVGDILNFVVEHSSHNSFWIGYTNGSEPDSWERVGAEGLELPEPCGTCRGRGMVPCPSC